MYPVTPTLSVAAVQVRLIWLDDAAVAASALGALGGVVSAGGGELPAPRKATTCMTQPPAKLSGAVAVYDPVADTTRSSALSPSGFVMIRLVKPLPAPLMPVSTT